MEFEGFLKNGIDKAGKDATDCIMGNVGSNVFGPLPILSFKNLDIVVSVASILTILLLICVL